ncbi:F-US11 protein [Chelonid alphaherpesvirus 5]|uniref:F-US11 protein n=1 Tax=Chelonid alphaherpesvirus 5 TaxID=702736 RepID=V5NXA0_9ALPH|nr:F-US11 protein [Chelonid alphaherpesvirus 5]AHA93299.1 F-US11 protein [Chelonid alphaherpesvirus 5]
MRRARSKTFSMEERCGEKYGSSFIEYEAVESSESEYSDASDGDSETESIPVRGETCELSDPSDSEFPLTDPPPKRKRPRVLESSDDEEAEQAPPSPSVKRFKGDPEGRASGIGAPLGADSESSSGSSCPSPESAWRQFGDKNHALINEVAKLLCDGEAAAADRYAALAECARQYLETSRYMLPLSRALLSSETEVHKGQADLEAEGLAREAASIVQQAVEVDSSSLTSLTSGRRVAKAVRLGADVRLAQLNLKWSLVSITTTRSFGHLKKPIQKV